MKKTPQFKPADQARNDPAFEKSARLLQRLEMKATLAEGVKLTVHYMRYGMTPCFISGTPSEWPENHTWSENWKDVNCDECIRVMKSKKEPHKITPAAHKKRHVELHQSLDELVADWLYQTGKLPSKNSVLELMQWSHAQTQKPTEPKSYGVSE